jgi:predicted O-linked N-acetylglucosamine transferase (SPINDLY family)
VKPLWKGGEPPVSTPKRSSRFARRHTFNRAGSNREPYYDYLKQYQQIDIALDPFPCNGGTTTCNALWMGVPVITFSGKTAVGRGGVSVLRNVGLTELIAGSTQHYVQIAGELASNPARLSELRQGMRDRMRASSLMESSRFARNVEAAYHQMWQTWCAKGTG